MIPHWLRVLEELKEKAKSEKESPDLRSGQHSEHLNTGGTSDASLFSKAK